MDNGYKPKVIVVDDEESIRKMLVKLLATKGIDTLSAESAERGLDILLADEEAKSIKIVISDYCMPGMKGDELFENIGKKYNYIFKIMMSGYCDGNERRIINNRIADEFYEKPLNFIGFLTRVDDLLKSRYWESAVGSGLDADDRSDNLKK